MKINYQGSNNEKIRSEIAQKAQSDPDIQAFLNSSPDELDIWIEGSVSDLKSAKYTMKKMAKIIRCLVSYVGANEAQV